MAALIVLDRRSRCSCCSSRRGRSGSSRRRARASSSASAATSRTLDPGLTIVMPFIDRVRPLIDLREQVVTFPPQPVITEDNVVVQIDTVLYFTITDAEVGHATRSPTRCRRSSS